MFNAANRKRPYKATGATKNNAFSSSSSSNTNANDNDNADSSNSSIIKSKKCSTPPTTISMNGIDVHFPFTPYDVQRDYMTSVLTALQNSQHALLESPTGTGKTLCLLCSALAWQQQEKGRLLAGQHSSEPQQPSVQSASNDGENGNEAPVRNTNKPPVIIYASRTHSQLSQVVNELRNTRYRPKHAVLGSREHMCIHPRVHPTVANKASKGSKSKSGNKSNNNNNTSSSSSSSQANVEAKTSTEVNNGCNKLCKERKCMYRNTLEEKAGGKNGVWHPPSNERVAAGSEYEQPVLDMEDLITVGKEHKICPFYHTRSLLKDAELIFVPYNYLFDRDARETTLAEVDFQNAVLIFDEAHNLEEFASESSSFDLSSSDLAGCVNEIQRAIQYLELNPDMGDGPNMKDNMLRLKSLLLNFETYLSDDITTDKTGVGQSKLSKDGEASYPGEFIFEIFETGARTNHANMKVMMGFLKKVQDVIMEFKGNTSGSGTPKLDHFINCLKRTFGTGTELLAMARAKSYRVHVTKMSGDGKNSGGGGGFKDGRTISYWCFAPALAMRELSFLKVRSILITSGTLSPLPSFSMELGLNFPVMLENDHVIQSDQVFVRVVGKGVSGKELSSKYGRRDDPEYISELGNTLASLCRQIPGGVLVFFPSYSAMEKAVQGWGGPASERFGGRQSGGGRGAAFFAAKRSKKKPASAKYVFPMIPSSFQPANGTTSSAWQRLLARKAIVLEPRSTKDLGDAIGEFKRFIARPKSTGAILMGVCRGKISEGIDFSDDMCRAVVVTGLPFAPYMDPKVKLKREFLDAARASSKSRPSIDGGFGNGKLPVKYEAPPSSRSLSGAEWYNQQAHRAVNQALGRVIRHRHDYGAVLLLDHRFAQTSNREGLSKWLRPHLRDESFGLTNRGLIQFYKESKVKAEKTKAMYTVQQPNPPQGLNLKYESDEEEHVSKVAYVEKSSLAKDDALVSGYVQENLITKRYDLNDRQAPTPTKNREEDFMMGTDDSNSPIPDSKPPAVGLGSLYGKGVKPQAAPTRSSLAFDEKKTSSFGGIDKVPRADNSLRAAKKDPIKRRAQPTRKSEAATLGAKAFFGKAQVALCKEDLVKVPKLLVVMKSYGDSKNDQQYMKTAKELILVLVNGQVDIMRIQLISSLFPLLPMKYRYKIEKMAAILAFHNSALCSQCKTSNLTEQDFSTIKSFVLPLLFNQSSSYDPIATTDRALLEDSEKIMNILVKHEINLQHFFDLLPERQLRRVRALAMEMKRTRDVARAKERSAKIKGEGCVTEALFRPASKPSTVSVTQKSENLEEDAESQKILSTALSQAVNVNRQKKDRVIDFQKKNESKLKTPVNPYRPAIKDYSKRNLLSAITKGNGHAAASKRMRKGAPVISQGSRTNNSPKSPMDMVDRCLKQVNSDGFVHPKSRLNRINGKINAHVPRGMVCVICSETPKEPLMASCNHSACSSCWKLWLKKSKTCPTCRAPAQMKDLAKLVFSKSKGIGAAPTLTQICASEDEEEEGSDNEELEIVAN